jgi:hypothetical protein
VVQPSVDRQSSQESRRSYCDGGCMNHFVVFDGIVDLTTVEAVAALVDFKS